MSRLTASICTLLTGLGFSSVVYAQTWTPVAGDQDLRSFMDGRTLALADGKDRGRRGVYNADGTGTLYAWGGEFDRQWEIRDGEWICMLIEPLKECYRLERSTSDPSLYRVTTESTGLQTEIRDSGDGTATVQPVSAEADPNQGGATAPSADELAAKLSNPTAPVMTIGNNFDYVTFDGDLPGASDQDAVRYVFQTVFPFKLSDGASVFFRPGIPVLFNEPVPAGPGAWDSVGVEIGDIGYDFSYGKTTANGFLWGLGVAGTIPTATDDRLGKDLWGLGPELLLGKIGKWGVVGGLISHQWDIGGSGKGEIDLTSISYFYAFPLGNGWQFASGPIVSYDHTRESGERWTIPLGIGLAKTAVIGGRPWKFQLQYWNYVERNDAFAAEHQVRLSINPVVTAPWNKGK